MLKRLIAMILAATSLMCLASCVSKDNLPDSETQDPPVTIQPAEVTEPEEDLVKELVPLEYQEGETMESPYYRIVTANDELCYEIQPKDEDEPMYVPITSVIYIVGSADECKVEKVSFEYTPEGGDPETIEQYRIYATSTSGATVAPTDDPESASTADPEAVTTDDPEVTPEGSPNTEPEAEPAA